MKPADAIASIPLLADLKSKTISWRRLGGFTNDNYRLTGDGFDYILRLPRADTNRWINRQSELHNLQQAVACGITPAFLYFNDSGVMLSDNLSTAQEMTVAQLENATVLAQVIATIKRVHQIKPAFKGQVDLAVLVDRFYHLMSAEDQLVFRDEYQLVTATLAVLQQEDAGPRVSSHNDLVLQNMLVQNGHLWLIDWEYSSRASPYWDLATLCNEVGVDQQDANDIIQMYGDTEGRLELRQLNRYRQLLQFVGDCWFRTFNPSC